MFSIFNSNQNKKFARKSLLELKELTRILFIDDEEIDIVKSIANEGWRIKYLSDLDKFDNTDLKDAHIVCIDILGVGKLLHIQGEGMGLVKNIAELYPNKKIILCSSVATHDIFDESIDLVDKKVPKDGQTYPFIQAIEELSKKYFDWDSCIEEIYFRFKSEFGHEISLEDFNKKMKKCFNSSGEVDTEKVLKLTNAGVSAASMIVKLLEFFNK